MAGILFLELKDPAYAGSWKPCTLELPYYLKMSDIPPTTEATPPPTPDNSNPFTSNGISERAITGGPEWWRRSFAYMTNMGMTVEERAQFEVDRGLKREQEQCIRCEKWRDYNLRYSLSTPTMPAKFKIY